jgi:hypothetical protein
MANARANCLRAMGSRWRLVLAWRAGDCCGNNDNGAQSWLIRLSHRGYQCDGDRKLSGI